MAVVTGKMLHRSMSEPRWNAAQEAEAERLVAAVEAELEARLLGTRISPVERAETVRVTAQGMLATTLPVAQLLELGGVVVEDGELPDGYERRDGYLWASGLAGTAGAGSVTTSVYGEPFAWPWTRTAPSFSVAPYRGSAVAIRYLGGWGPEPALVEAILRKAHARMGRRHSDTVVVGGLNATPPGDPSPLGWTEEELAALGRYRNLGWAG